MGSTNHTASLSLSQFVDTDKPTWRGDYNGDMTKIDSAIAARIAEDNVLQGEITANLNKLHAVVLNIKDDFGAVGDGVTDDTNAFKTAMAPNIGATPDTLTTGTFVNLIIPPGTYKVTCNQIIWDIYRCKILFGDGVNLVFNDAASTDWGITVLSTAPSTSGTGLAATPGIASGGFMMSGNRKGTALQIHGVTAGANVAAGKRFASDFQLHRIVVNNWHLGTDFANNAYNIEFNSIVFNSCDRWVACLNGQATNSGERITFVNCSFVNQVAGYNNPTQMFSSDNPGINVDSFQEMHFDRCSFDYISQLLFCGQNAMITFDQCHIETPTNYMLQPGDLIAGERAFCVIREHGVVTWNKCKWLIAANDPTLPIPYLIDLNGWANAVIRDCHGFFNVYGAITGKTGGIIAWGNTPNVVTDNLTYTQDQVSWQPIRTKGDSFFHDSLSLASKSSAFTESNPQALDTADKPAVSGVLASWPVVGANSVLAAKSQPTFTPRYLILNYWVKAMASGLNYYETIQCYQDGNEIDGEHTLFVSNAPTVWTEVTRIIDLRHNGGGGLQACQAGFALQVDASGGTIKFARLLFDAIG